MMIDDLNDEMLREILCRLPCYRTALRCRAVTKRWCSIISDPLFISQGFLTHRGINKKEPSSIILLTMQMWDENFVTAMIAPPCFQRTLWSPILSLQFLPFHSKPVATFKDLILTFGVNPLTSLGVFSICNPLTKQWMVLPPTQTHKKPVIWAALICLEGRGFRIVVSDSNPKYSEEPFGIINLIVYVSETCQWKNIDVRVKLQPSSDSYRSYKGVGCNGMVCIYYKAHFGAFNPFDVTDTFHGTLTAINLPLPGTSFQFSESDGKLVAYPDAIIYITLSPGYSRPQRIWKCDLGRLENDEQVVEWELISTFFDGYINNVKGSILASCDDIKGFYYFKVLGVHPTNESLLYLIKEDRINKNHQLFLFDTKSKSLEPLTTTIPPYTIIQASNYKLDIPSWPTPIPFA